MDAIAGSPKRSKRPGKREKPGREGGDDRVPVDRRASEYVFAETYPFLSRFVDVLMVP